jgi:hypothetical protein
VTAFRQFVLADAWRVQARPAHPEGSTSD